MSLVGLFAITEYQVIIIIDNVNLFLNNDRWDTAGQERFKCMAAAYYRGAHGKTLVFYPASTVSFLTFPLSLGFLTGTRNQRYQNLATVVHAHMNQYTLSAESSFLSLPGEG